MKDSMQDLIDRYIRGEMSVEERISFEKQLSENEELKEMFDFTLNVSEAIKNRTEKLKKINNWNKEETTSEKIHKQSNKLKVKVMYGVLGAAALLAIVLYLNHCPSMPELDTQHYECYRGGNDLVCIAELINDEQYDSALDKIIPMEEDCKSDIDSISKLLHTASSQSADRLEYELSANKADWQGVEWLKVYAFLGLKRYKEARQLLKKISTTPGIYQERADSLLDEL